MEKANNFHPTIRFTDEMSETEITFLDTKVYRGVRFDKETILDVQTHYNQQTCNPPGVKKGFIKGEALRPLRTNSSQITFEPGISEIFKTARLPCRYLVSFA